MNSYTQVATAFADLHDTPARMLAKGVIHGVVPWAAARSFFYWRIRRLLAEKSTIRRLLAAAPQMTTGEAGRMLQSWFYGSISGVMQSTLQQPRSHTAGGPIWGAPSTSISTMPLAASPVSSATPTLGRHEDAWRDDKLVLRWLAETRGHLEERIYWLRRENIRSHVLSYGLEDPTAVISGVLEMLPRLTPDHREAVVAALRRGVIFGAGAGPSLY